MALPLDHLAVVARTLDEGCAHVRECLGVEMGPGGRHPAMGTHNRLLSLGPDCYLEVIAIDPEAPAPGRPRWFGLDAFDGAPRLATWLLRSSALTEDLARAPEAGRATPMQRDTLRWLISVRGDGTLPMGGAFPSLIEWQTEPLPPARLPDSGCRLRGLTLIHPEPDALRAALAPLDPGDFVTLFAGESAGLSADIDTPQGRRRLF